MSNSRPRSAFTTPANVNDQLQKADVGASDTPVETEFDDYFALVQTYCFAMSKIIESETHRTFTPYFASKELFFTDILRDNEFVFRSPAYILKLDEDLLAVDSITFMDTVLTTSQYRLVDFEVNSNGYPYREIHFNSSGLPSWNTQFDSSITIVGEWGTHDNSSDAYVSVTTLAVALSDTTGTSVSIPEGLSSNLQIYQYIRVEDELMFITAITLSSSNPDVLTVERGALGSTAATHANSTALSRWRVVDDIELLSTRMVAFWYNKRNDKGERIQVIDDAIVIAEFSKELKAIAARRQVNAVGVV